MQVAGFAAFANVAYSSCEGLGASRPTHSS